MLREGFGATYAAHSDVQTLYKGVAKIDQAQVVVFNKHILDNRPFWH